MRARVRVPARAHRRTNYCSHVDLSMTPKRVSQHVRINRKKIPCKKCVWPMAMVKQKWHRICRKNRQRYEEKPNKSPRSQDRVLARTENCSNHLFYYLYLCMCMKSCKKTVKTIKTPGGGSIITFVRNLEILRSRRRLLFFK